MEERIIKDINNLLTQLFQKMKEAGYEWDAEKKELKKIENKKPLLSDFFKAEYERGKSDAQKSSWSEEDEDMIQALNACIDVAIKSGMNYISFDSKSILIGKVKTWLKSIKERYTWKPSAEQMEALKNAIHIKPYENPSDSLLWGLYEQLKELKGIKL